MSAPAPHRPAGGRLAAVRDAGLWLSAAAVVTGLHVGAMLWMLRQPAEAAMDGGPPPSIMIDMAPMPTAADTGETQVSPDAVDSMPNEAPPVEQPPQETPPDPEPPPPDDEPQPEPPEEQEPQVEPEPEQEIPPEPVVEPPPEPEQELPPEQEPQPQPEEVVEEIVETRPEVLPEAEVAMPVTRSPRPPPRPEREPEPERQAAKKPEPKREPPKPRAAPSEAAAKARTEAPRAERTAAPQDSAGANAAVSPAKWKSKVMSHLLRRKPRSNGDRGAAHIRFTVDGGGNVVSAQVTKSSGSARIDKAVLDMIRRASPMPAPPPGVDRTLTGVVEFK